MIQPSSVSPIQIVVTEVPQRDIPGLQEKSEDLSKHSVKVDQFPEGGTAAWCTVAGAALVQLCSLGYSASFGVYQDFYTLKYLNNESASAISWIGGINVFLVTSTSLVAGALYDRGLFYPLMIGSSLLESFALFMLSLARPGQYYQIFLTQGIGLGIAQGLMYVPSMAVVSHYFRQDRTLAMSLVTAGSSAGSIVHPIMLNYLINRGVGFANGVRISAAFVSALLLVACLLMRTRIEPPQHPVNYTSVGRGIIHDVPFCIMSMGFLLFQVGFYYPPFYLQLDSVKHGNSETFSFYSLTLLNGGSLLGRLSSGFIAPHTGVPWLMIASTAACAILIIGMIGLSSIPTVVVLSTIYGYFSGIYIAMGSTLMALLTKDVTEIGARMGICIAISGIGAMIGGPISGALLTSQYNWWRPSLFAGLIEFTGCSLLVMMQVVLTRNRKSSTAENDP